MKTKNQIRDWLAFNLMGRDLLFLTITSQYAVDREVFSSAIRIYLRKINRNVFGYRSKNQLCSVVIFEKNYRQGVHAHLILENPKSVVADRKFNIDDDIGEYLKKVWVKMRIGGKLVGQDCQNVTNLHGVLDYMTKTNFCPEFQDQIDINNLYLPINPKNNHFPLGIKNKVTRMIGESNPDLLS